MRFVDEQLELHDAAAIVHGDRSVSYRQLRESSYALARTLHESGVRPGSYVALFLERSIESVVAMYGALAAGAAYVPADIAAPKARLQYLLDTARPHAILVDRAGRRALAELNLPAKVQLVDVVRDAEIAPESAAKVWSLAESAPRAPEALERQPSDLAYIIFTSGSTGQPKGVMISHESLAAFVDGACSTVPFDRNTRYLNVTPLYFDGSVSDVYCTLSKGGTLFLQERVLLPGDVAASIQRFGITATLLQSSVLKMLASRFVDLNTYDLSSLRILWYGGESCPTNIIRKIARSLTDVTFVHGYGPTETTHSATLYVYREIAADAPAVLPIGKPMPGVIARTLDSELRPVERGAEGELFLGGPQVMAGYCGDPQRTSSALVELEIEPGKRGIFYRTGDYVSVDANGDIVFHGRRDDLVKVRGILLSLKEAERALLTDSSVQDAFVLTAADAEGAQVLHAVVVPSAGAQPNPLALGERVRQLCGAAAMPSHYHLISGDDVPRLPHGKLDLGALARHVLEAHGSKSRASAATESYE